MKSALRAIGGGLLIVLPLIVTLWVLVWFTTGAENVLGPSLKGILGTTEPSAAYPEGRPGWFGEMYYIPGMGIVLGLFLAVLAGLLARVWLFRVLIAWFERLIGRLPLLKTLYGGVKDLLGLVSGKRHSFSRVVLVRPTGTNLRLLGFVTQESLAAVPGLAHHADRVAVYISLSYSVGGFIVLVPRDEIEPVDMKVEDALRFALTAGVSVKEEPSAPK